MRNFLDEQLELLSVELIRMGALCEDAILKASKSLLGQSEDGLDEDAFAQRVKYFERIGDHATNIAEWVEYSITGVHVGVE